MYRVAPEWRQLPKEVRQEDKEQLESIIRQFSTESKSQVLAATTMGMMAQADFMIFSISASLEAVQGLATALAKSEIGGYLTRQSDLIGLETESASQENATCNQVGTGQDALSYRHPYLFVYPIKKKHEWFRLPLQERQELLDEQLLIAAKYQTLKLNTASSFGLSEQDFIVICQCANPQNYMELMQELRETKANSYTQNDAPFLTGIHMRLHEVLDTLG
ncbi:MAG: chlorite dismutase family protein [Candidatus Competibacteraceae bacterium]|nr:chlorite dismutase family protein [Candidatus Competibacteraceae bacterium]